MKLGITFVVGSILLAVCLAALQAPFSASRSERAQAQSAAVALPNALTGGQLERESNPMQSSTLAGPLASFPALRIEASADPPVQSTANPPHVDFRHGLLSIRAHDATISEVLRTVGKAMGATADLPATANERVTVQLGPGEPAVVLTSLLSALPYDYILVGSQRPSGPVARIMLMSRSNSPGQQPLASDNRAPPQPPAPGNALAEDAQQSYLQELKRQQEVEFQRQFGTCIAQRCDDS